MTPNHHAAVMAGNFLNLGMLLVAGSGHPMITLLVLLSWASCYLGSFLGATYDREEYHWMQEVACGLQWLCLAMGAFAFLLVAGLLWIKMS